MKARPLCHITELIDPEENSRRAKDLLGIPENSPSPMQFNFGDFQLNGDFRFVEDLN